LPVAGILRKQFQISHAAPVGVALHFPAIARKKADLAKNLFRPK
jgi:hypothetical protein